MIESSPRDNPTGEDLSYFIGKNLTQNMASKSRLLGIRKSREVFFLKEESSFVVTTIKWRDNCAFVCNANDDALMVFRKDKSIKDTIEDNCFIT